MVIVSAMTIHEWLLVFLCLKSCSCLDWSCSSSHCTARGSHSLTWKDAFSFCRKENGFLAFPTEEILENPEPLWTPLVRLPGKFFFQWLLKIPKLQRLEETELVTANTYNDSERCFVTNPRDGKLISQHCFTKSSFVCERSVGAENMTVLPRKNITVTLSVDTTDSRKLNGGSFQYVGYNHNFSDRTVPSFHCKVQYKENNMKLKLKNIVTNLLFNGYYVGRPSPWILKNIESKTKLDSIGDRYQIMTSSNYNPYNYFAEGDYQCAAWLPGEDQPVKSNTVALASSQAVYAILNRTIEVPDAADYVRNARLTGKPDGISRGCLHLEGGDCKEAWKLYGIEVKPGSNNSAVIMSYHIKTWTFSFKYDQEGSITWKSSKDNLIHPICWCSDSDMLNVTWKSVSGGLQQSSTPLCLTNNEELITAECHCSFKRGAERKFYIGNAKRFLKKSCPKIQRSYPSQCPKGFRSLGSETCYRSIPPGSWYDSISDCYKNANGVPMLPWNLNEMQEDIKENYPEYTEFWLANKRMGKGMDLFPMPINVRWTNASSHVDLWERLGFVWNVGQPAYDKECVVGNILKKKLLLKDCDNKLPMICIAQRYTERIRAYEDLYLECPNSWDGMRQLDGVYLCGKAIELKSETSWSDAKNICAEQKANVITLLDEPSKELFLTKLTSRLSRKSVCAIGMKRVGNTYVWEHNNHTSQITHFNWHPDTNFSKGTGVILTGENNRWALKSDVDCVICTMTTTAVYNPAIQLILGEENRIRKITYIDKNIASSQCYENLKPIKLNDRRSSYRIAHGGSMPEPLGDTLYFCVWWSKKSLMPCVSNHLIIRDSSVYTFACLLKDFYTEHHSKVNSILSSEEYLSNVATSIKRALRRIRPDYTLVIKEVKVIKVEQDNDGRLLAFCHIIVERSPQFSEVLLRSQMNSTAELLKALANYNVSLLYIRSTLGCVSETTRDINSPDGRLTWSFTVIGKTAISEEPCITKDGKTPRRKCSGTIVEGAHWKHPYDACYKKPSKVTLDLLNLSRTRVTAGNVKEALHNLSSLTSSFKTFVVADVLFTGTTLYNIASSASNLTTKGLIETLKVINNIAQAGEKVILEARNEYNSTNILISSVETIAESVPLPDKNEVFEHAEKEIAIRTFHTNSHPSIGVVYKRANDELKKGLTPVYNDQDINYSETDIGIVLPNGILKRGDRVSFLLYKTPILFMQNGEGINGSKYMSSTQVRKIRINDLVIRGKIRGNLMYDLNQPVTVIVKPQHPSRTPQEAPCGSYDFAQNDGQGGWNDQTCRYKKTVSGRYVCMCRRLAHFANIFYMDGFVSVEHGLILAYISTVGCILSIIGLSLTILTFLTFKKLREKQSNKAIIYLCFSLLIVYLVFVTGFDRSWHANEESSKTSCIAVGILLHYFLLASFSWMLLESVTQYKELVDVYNPHISKFSWKSHSFGWGFPLLTVTVTLAVDIDNYDSQVHYCWLHRDVILWTFVVPVGTIIITNCVFFIMIIKFLKKSQKLSMHCTQSAKARAKLMFRRGVIIFVLLGFTWGFGIFAVGSAKAIFSYLFAFSSTLQGFLIFIFYIAQGESIRIAWTRIIHRTISTMTTEVSMNLNVFSGSDRTNTSAKC